MVAIALSLMVLLTWSLLAPKPQPVVNKEVTYQASNLASPVELSSTKVVIAPEPPAASLFEIKRKKFDLTFIEPQAAIQEVKFKLHQDYKFPLKYGFLLADPTLSFVKEGSSIDSVTFLHSDQNKKIIKKFIFSDSDYSLWLEVSIENTSASSISVDMPLILGAMDLNARNVQSRYHDVAISTNEKSQHVNAGKNAVFQEAKFVGMRDRYFCAIVDPDSEKYSAFIKKINGESEVGLSELEYVLKPGEQISEKFHIYLGPQDLQTINSIKPDWSMVINYGTFDFISQVLLQMLEFLHKLVRNWGLAIVILSFLVYFLLYPLTLKQMRSMKEMQALQPHIEELRKAHTDNPQKLNKEIMELYKEHKVNPFGGCLPLILQMPIFFALYQALLRSIALKGASFLWIKDLSEPDRLFILPKTFPMIGNEINILPIVMAIGMFVQQKISMTATTGSQAEQQKMMLIIMPLMFGLIFYHMPSGLVLYWFINSGLMLINQIKISRAK